MKAKPKDKVIHVQVRLPAKLHRELKQRAKEDQRSLNSEILYGLQFYLSLTHPWEGEP